MAAGGVRSVDGGDGWEGGDEVGRLLLLQLAAPLLAEAAGVEVGLGQGEEARELGAVAR
ncbi:hypothetical protein [Oryza sativa Japonica Group]|uniref:Uncharacterized protein n=1 Tax=Oryza sativa subsp. japonica TaxID=39947 RepID=Q5ZAM4_ORYSJ|nr:hypothetical protein [Oryza sativa Japonica Group]